MSAPRARRFGVVVITGTCLVAAALPALADPVVVSLEDSLGSRQFEVQNITGGQLSTIDLGNGGSQPFRTVVTDSEFKNLTSGYSVSATMNNLYLEDGNGGYTWGTSVPSSDLSLDYGTSPLSALGVSFPVVPQLTVSGTLQSCADLDSTTKSVLGLSSLGAVLDLTDTALLNLCSALLTADNLGVTATVDSTVQQITSDLTSALALTELPTALTGATPGTFDNADYSVGTIGAGDAGGKAGAPAATSLGIMTGTPGMVSALQGVITTKVNAAIGGLPLTSATDPAKTTIAALLEELGASTNTAVANVATALGALDAAQQSAVLNTLSSVTVVAPQLTDLLSLSAQYYGFPILRAAPSTPLAGSYKGTMTVTFVQE